MPVDFLLLFYIIHGDIFALWIHIDVSYIFSSFSFTIADALQGCVWWTKEHVLYTNRPYETHTRKCLTLVVTDGCWPPLLSRAHIMYKLIERARKKSICSRDCIASGWPWLKRESERRREKRRKEKENNDSYCTIGHSTIVFKVIKHICICTCS